MNIAIRVDASSYIGTGHLVRCLTLAKALREKGATIYFISRIHERYFYDVIEQQGFQVKQLINKSKQFEIEAHYPYAEWLETTWWEDAAETVKIIETIEGKPTWLVVDHYAIDERWHRVLRPSVEQIMVIDDLANRIHDCDLLLDQNFYGDLTNIRYLNRVPSHCKCLLGPNFALLKEEFGELCRILPPRSGNVFRILIFFGGSDLNELTNKVLTALSYPELAFLAVDVVLGPNYPNPQKIKDLVAKRNGTRLYQDLPSLAGLMMRSDFFIGAGGATTWERVCLRLPSLIVSVAKNQEGFTNLLAEKHCQLLMPKGKDASVEDWKETILQIIKQPEYVEKLYIQLENWVDGHGTKRIINAMLENENNLTICGTNQYYSKRQEELPSVISSAEAKNVLQPFRITILSDKTTWIYSTIQEMKLKWLTEGHLVRWVYDPIELEAGDICFILSCSQILEAKHLVLHRHNLVVHSSELPHGKGWSPMSWQILEGKNKICTSLFEAEVSLDSGAIYSQKWIELDGTELISEWHAKQAEVTKTLCYEWLSGFPKSADNPRQQEGESTYYKRRTAKDSMLEPDKTIREQFNLLRIVDNEKYPAFFDIHGYRYQIKIEKVNEPI